MKEEEHRDQDGRGGGGFRPDGRGWGTDSQFLPSGFRPFFHFFGKGSDSFEVNEPKKDADSFFPMAAGHQR